MYFWITFHDIQFIHFELFVIPYSFSWIFGFPYLPIGLISQAMYLF